MFFLIFGKQKCPLCVKAAKVIEKLGVGVLRYDIENDPESLAMFSEFDSNPDKLPLVILKVFAEDAPAEILARWEGEEISDRFLESARAAVKGAE